jgi:hypothetical protein
MSNKNKQWTIEDIKRLKIDFSNTALLPSYFENYYERSFASIHVKARELGLKRGKPKVYRRKKHYLPKNEIKQLYLAGKSTRQLAKIYDCSFPTISNLLKEIGVIVKDNVSSVKKYQLNEDYFERVDSEEKAYFLGFIAADGYVNNKYCSLSFAQHVQDKEILTNLIIALGSNHIVKERLMSSGKKKEKVKRVWLQIINKKIVTDLNNLGIVQKKSLVLNFPSIKEEYYSSFIKGYFDGDGSIFDEGFNLLGTENLLKKCQQILMKNCGLSETKISKVKNIYSLNYSGKQQLKRIFDFLYQHKGFKLERKYEKFRSIIQ